MQQLQQLVDLQWSNYQDLVHRSSKTKIHIPCLEGVYERIRKVKDLTTKQRHKVDQIKTKLRQNGLLSNMNKFNNTTLDAHAKNER